MEPRARGRWLALVAALAGQACALHSAPSGWLPREKDLPRWSRGAWIEVEPVPGAGRKAAGELIALGEDEIHVLTEAGLRAIPAAQVASATLVLYDPDDSGGWGLALSLTHGRYLPLTLIPWMAISTGESHAPLLRHPPWALSSFRPYARFPQGLPPGLKPKDLGPLSGVPPSQQLADGHEPIALGLELIEDERHHGARRGSALIPDMEQYDRARPDPSHALGRGEDRVGSRPGWIRVDVPGHGRPPRAPQEPGQADELPTERRPEVDLALVTGGTDQLVRTLHLRPDELLRMQHQACM
jgi:hypothetical protein